MVPMFMLIMVAKMKSYFYFYYKAGILGVLFSDGRKKAKIEYLDLKKLLFSRIGGVTPPPPLNGKSLCSKKFSGKGGYPAAPLNGQNPLIRFDSVPNL